MCISTHISPYACAKPILRNSITNDNRNMRDAVQCFSRTYGSKCNTTSGQFITAALTTLTGSEGYYLRIGDVRLDCDLHRGHAEVTRVTRRSPLTGSAVSPLRSTLVVWVLTALVGYART